MRTMFAILALGLAAAAPARAQTVPTPLHMNVNLSSNGYQAAAEVDAGVLGAGVNGPGHAQVGLAVNLNKAYWWTPGAAVGEVDGVYSTIYQGGPGSDTSAYLGQITATGLGFASVLEGTVTIQPPITTGNGVRDAMLDVQMGVINIGSQIYGGTANLSLKPAGATAVGWNLNGVGWDYLAQWWNGSTDEFSVDGAGDVQAHGAIQAGLVTTASLPASCAPGQQLFATDGRKAGEAAGAGSGVPVICAQTKKNGATAWYSLWTGAVVAG